MRAVIYARYSTENQREASLADQQEICRRYIERQGWELTQTYNDAAISGASRFRPGFASLTADAQAGRFEIVVCEAIDRLGRKLSDVADLFDRLTFHRVELHTTSIGLISQMHIGIMGTMAQMTLTDLRDKTRRGQLGRARLGKIPGGLAFGYEVVAPAAGSRDGGERRILEGEAATVRRIFTAYAGGQSPRSLARQLNEESVPGPGGRPWIDTTIRGQGDRGTGLLNNTLYVGQLSWNRCSYIKDPSTGRRIARANKAADYEVVEVPHLRIVDQALWDSVKARQAAVTIVPHQGAGNRLNGAHRPRFLLSGVLVCGCCGGGYTVVAQDRYGCATRRGKGTCNNSHTIMRQHIEARVLDSLREHMLTPEMVEEFVLAFEAELAVLRQRAGNDRLIVAKELEQAERKLAGVVRAIEDGAWNPTLRARLTELEQSKAAAAGRLQALNMPAAPPRLAPNAAALYRDKVAELQASLNSPGILTEATETLRRLIEKVVLTPDAAAADGLRAELHGDLAMILSLAASPAPSRKLARSGSGGEAGTSVPGSLLSVVAGIGFEPMTFRL